MDSGGDRRAEGLVARAPTRDRCDPFGRRGGEPRTAESVHRRAVAVDRSDEVLDAGFRCRKCRPVVDALAGRADLADQRGSCHTEHDQHDCRDHHDEDQRDTLVALTIVAAAETDPAHHDGNPELTAADDVKSTLALLFGSLEVNAMVMPPMFCSVELTVAAVAELARNGPAVGVLEPVARVGSIMPAPAGGLSRHNPAVSVALRTQPIVAATSIEPPDTRYGWKIGSPLVGVTFAARRVTDCGVVLSDLK